MSSLRNSVQLIGHLGADPEMKTLENGTVMARIRLVTTDSYKTTTGGWREETQWHSITLWEAMAERAGRQLQKGSFVLVQGKLINRTFTDAQGVKKYATDIRASNLISLDKNKEASESSAGTQAAAYKDNLPF